MFYDLITVWFFPLIAMPDRVSAINESILTEQRSPGPVSGGAGASGRAFTLKETLPQKQVKAPSIWKSAPVVKGLASPARYTAIA